MGKREDQKFIREKLAECIAGIGAQETGESFAKDFKLPKKFWPGFDELWEAEIARAVKRISS
jgi:hypothetical protein